MEGLEAKDVYLALTRLELRYGIKIIQIFNDSGTQLSAITHTLGGAEGCLPAKAEQVTGSLQQHSLLPV